MDHPYLYDLSPLFWLKAIGILVALGPLVWVWYRGRHMSTAGRLGLLTGVTLFFTIDLILFGVFTRLTDSGLGCPDWPGCFGKVSPIGAHDYIAAAQASFPLGPVTFPKAWIEMIHRYLATGVGVMILVLAFWSWREREQTHVSVFWPIVTLIWVCIQGAFGALTVTMKLFPAIVTMHLLGGMILLALLRLQGVRYKMGHVPGGLSLPLLSIQPGTRRWLWVVFAAVWVQMALGGWVSTNYAALACRDFPTCQGSWWPYMDFSAGFQLWRELGMQRSGDSIPFEALTAIHFTHRLGAYVVFTLFVYLAWRFWRVEGKASHAWILLGLIAWQALSGVSIVLREWPILIALSHSGGAAAMVFVLTGWLTAAYPARAPKAKTSRVSVVSA
jgi:cytochrome c oxidase assembly protein subunit 15